MKQNLGVISEEDYIKNNPIRRITERIINREWNPCSTREINKIIDQRYFGFDSLVSLTDQEELLLRESLLNEFLFMFKDSNLREFLESTCFVGEGKIGELNVFKKEVVKNKNDDTDRFHFLSDQKNLHRMSKKEKLAFLSNPVNLDALWHKTRLVSPFGRMGYRAFTSYPISERFAELISELKSSGGKERLHVLDLGGGPGRALSDIKKEYPELITYNATRDEEFSHYPTDFHIISFMERMPLALKGTIDLIFSNMATRYFAFTDLAIQCCVSMLAKGGIMDVFFSSECSDNPSRKDVKRRTRKAYNFLKEMESAGIIELKIESNYTSNLGGSFQSGEGTLYPAASVFVRKLI